MDRTKLVQIESEEALAKLLKEHDLFREEDVTFEDLGGTGNMYVYTGNDFRLDADMLAGLEVSALLIDGNFVTGRLSVSDILSDFGVFCVSGDVRCKDFKYVTESTGMVVGGNFIIDDIGYVDCGNSVLQVNKDLEAKLFFNAQCSVEVRGRQKVALDARGGGDALRSLGLALSENEAPAAAIRAYLER